MYLLPFTHKFDGLGFRVAATNLPQAPVAAPIAPVAAAETPVAVVPEVKTTDVPVVAPAAAPVATAPVVAPAYVANSWGNPSPYVYAAQAAPVYTTNYVPVAPVSTPVAAPVPVVAAASPIKASQFHAQVEYKLLLLIYFMNFVFLIYMILLICASYRMNLDNTIMDTLIQTLPNKKSRI